MDELFQRQLLEGLGQLFKGRGHGRDLGQPARPDQAHRGIRHEVQGHGQLAGHEALGDELGPQPLVDEVLEKIPVVRFLRVHQVFVLRLAFRDGKLDLAAEDLHHHRDIEMEMRGIGIDADLFDRTDGHAAKDHRCSHFQTADRVLEEHDAVVLLGEKQSRAQGDDAADGQDQRAQDKGSDDGFIAGSAHGRFLFASGFMGWATPCPG